MLEQTLSFGDHCVGHGVTAEAAFFGLYADVGHGNVGCAFQVTVAVGGNTNYRTFGHIKQIAVDLKLAGSGKNDVVFFVFLVAVKERNSCARGERTE